MAGPSSQRWLKRGMIARRPSGRTLRLVRTQVLIGVAVAIAAVAAGQAGWVTPLAYPLEDAIVQRFDAYTPEVSEDVCVVAIDDASILQVGRWPWNRSLYAEIVELLDELGAQTIVFDVAFPDRQAVQIVKRTGAEGEESFEETDHDAVFADAIARHGNVVLAMRAQTVQAASFVRGAAGIDFWSALGLTRARPQEATPEALCRMETDEPLTPDDPRMVGARYELEMADSFEVAGPLLSVPLEDASARWPWMGPSPRMPVPDFGRASAGLGNSSIIGTAKGQRGDADGVVRHVPLWVSCGERVHPLLGLAGALAHVDAGARMMPPTPEATVVASEQGELRLVSMKRSMPGLDVVAGMHRVCFPSGEEWSAQLSRDDGSTGVLSVAWLMETRRVRDNTRALLAQWDNACGDAVRLLEVEGAEGYADDATVIAEAVRAMRFDAAFEAAIARQERRWQATLDAAGGAIESLRGTVTNESPREERVRFALARMLTQQGAMVRDRLLEGLGNLAQRSPEELERLRGGLVFIGSTATKSGASDVVPTPIAGETPGVFVHAAVANALLTGHELRPSPPWLDAAATLTMGLLGTALGVLLTPWAGLILGVGLCYGWWHAAGTIWDAGDVTIAAASPMVAVMGSWLGVSLWRALVEQRERKRTEARFKSYVSPEVVDILVNNPTLSSMRPQLKELSVLFSDIAGFTTISEKLGTERTSDALGEYLRRMTAILQDTRATLDKYLGDGIMAFWGAPIDDPDHAAHACDAALRMLEEIDQLNADEVFEETGPIAVRIGVATGPVRVGDFGNPPLRSAYTVLGDTVNLAARLESANKYAGSSVLINQRAAELVRERMTLRPIGQIVVVGKTEPQSIFEVIGNEAASGDAVRERIAQTSAAIEAFGRRDFVRALRGFDELAERFGDEKLAMLYRRAIDRFMRGEQEGPPVITLDEK